MLYSMNDYFHIWNDYSQLSINAPKNISDFLLLDHFLYKKLYDTIKIVVFSHYFNIPADYFQISLSLGSQLLFVC